MDDAQQVNCHGCPIDFLRIWEQMWDPPSIDSLEPKLPLERHFDYQIKLARVLGNNSCCYKRKFLKEIGESLPQNLRRTARSEFVFAWKVARFEAGTPLLIWLNE
jgi:hypothetical protein